MTFDPLHFKQQFPLFSQTENQHLVYLDNAATTQKPQCVLNAIHNFYLHSNGNAQRASHRLARKATQLIEATREKTADFLGAKSPKEIVFTHGATESLNIIAFGLRSRLSPQDEILISASEHHANLLPWQSLAKASGASIRYINVANTHWLETITDKTQLISLAAANNSLGSCIDLEALRHCKQRHPNIIIVIDASQWLCHRPVDAKNWPCDFLVGSPHKFYGPTGLGILYGKEAQLNQLTPLILGGEMVDEATLQDATFRKAPERFEAGTSPSAAIASLHACLTFLGEQDREAIAAYEKHLTHLLHQKLALIHKQFPQVKILSSTDHNIGIATLHTEAPFSVSDLGIWLDNQEIAVRVGNHCAQPLWRQLAIENSLRISLTAYNTEEDIDKICQSISAYCQHIAQDSGAVSIDFQRQGYEQLPWQELAQCKNWQQRYKKILQWGKGINSTTAIREKRYLIAGCESPVWLKHQERQAKHYFLIDSDANIIKGLAAIFLSRIDGKTTEEIRSIDFDDYFSALGLQKHLSPSRQNGFYALFQGAMNYIDL